MTSTTTPGTAPRDVSRINMDGLMQGMDAAGLDVLVAAWSDNFTYITGTLLLSHWMIPDRLCTAVVPRDGQTNALLCYCEEQQTRQESWITDIDTYLEFKQRPMHALAAHLEERGYRVARIGIEKCSLAAGVRYPQTRGYLPTTARGYRPFKR